MFCPRCGRKLTDGAKFCASCGAEAIPPATPPAQPSDPGVRAGVPAPGFSDRVLNPEVLAAVKKNKKASGLFLLFVVPLPLIGFLIYSLVSDKMEPASGLLYGAILSGVFLVFALIGFLRGKTDKPYEAVVTARTTRTRQRKNGDNVQETTEYVTVVRTSDGREKKIVESGPGVRAYTYLNVGDRFRYHPSFIFPYERFDKASASCLYCAGCGASNPVENDRCRKCGIPLIK